MNRISSRIVLGLILVMLSAQIAPASNAIPGLPPFGSFSGGPFDIVDNANLNVHFGFPVLVKNGRGLPLNYQRRYDSWVYELNLSTAWTPRQNFGWASITESLLGMVANWPAQQSCIYNGNTYYYHVYSHWHFAQPANPGHDVMFDSLVLSDASTTTPCTGSFPPYSGTVTATDGSGFTLSATALPSATVYSRSGSVLNPTSYNSGSSPATLTDTNGNQIGSTIPGNIHINDTLGTIALDVSGQATQSAPYQYVYTPAAGGSATVQVNYTTKTVQTNFGCGGISEYGPSSYDLVTSIGLPDGTSYTFTYETTPGFPSNVTGRIASITLPTGGQITYSYTGGSNGINCADGSPAGLTRVTPDGTWTYTRSGSGSAWTTTITDPQSNQTVLNFQGIYETQRQSTHNADRGDELLG